MRIFEDTKGRKWELNVNVPVDKRVRALTGKSLFSIHEGIGGETIAEVLENAEFILFAVIEPQAKLAGVNYEDFGTSLDGEKLRAAWDSLLDEIYDFFLHWNPPLAAALRKAREMADLLLGKATEAVQSIQLSGASA